MKKLISLIVLSLLITFSGTQSTEAASISSIKTEAFKYLGTPYKYGGNSTSGFDCSAFVQRVFKDLGISIPRDTGSQYKEGKAVSKSNLELGDLVFFNTNGKGVSHVGIYIGDNKFVHAATSKGVSVTSLSDPYYWGSKYIGAKRIAEESASEVKAAATEVNATRGEVAMVLANKLNLSSNNTTSNFNDVQSNSAYFEAIQAVSDAGIFTGDNNGNFNPSNHLTRAELAKVLVNAFGLEAGSGSYSFSDVSASYWAAPYIQVLAQHNITRGMGDGTFGISDNLTKSQLNMFIERIK